MQQLLLVFIRMFDKVNYGTKLAGLSVTQMLKYCYLNRLRRYIITEVVEAKRVRITHRDKSREVWLTSQRLQDLRMQRHPQNKEPEK